MAYTTLEYSVAQSILTLTLNRPERMNAFTVTMADELVDAFNRASRDDQVRAIVLTGAGRAFCAGMDLSVGGNVFGLDEARQPTLADMHERLNDADIERGVRDTGGRVTLAMFECNKPIIAAVNGVAVGIGSTMILAADIRLASEQARFGFVFGKIGIVPESCATWFLPRLVGMAQALEWVYSGEIFDAQEAQRTGLIRQVVAPETLLEEALRIARKFTENRSPVGVALTRQMMYRNASLNHPLEAHKIESLAVFYASQNDGKEGVRAFLEKRTPQFKAQVSTDMPPFYPWWQ